MERNFVFGCVFSSKSSTITNDRIGLGDINDSNPFSRESNDIQKFQKKKHFKKNGLEFLRFSLSS